MRKSLLLFFIIACFRLSSQTVTCPDTAIYFQNGTSVYKYYPNQPTSATNPALILSSMPGQGLAICNNLNVSGPSPTFYTTVSGMYYYWNGSTWVNTGHTTGISTAVNPGGGGCYIYNLVGGTGDVYKYDGTGNATLLTTVAGFSGGGPYDLACDVDGSFFVLRTLAPQAMYHYDQTGSLLTTFTMTGMPSTSAGGGFSVFGNEIYVSNSGGFFKGTINFTSISFTNIPTAPSQLTGASDFGNCATLSTGYLSYAFTNSGPLTCSTNTANVSAGGWPSSTTYSWSGPSIAGATTNSTAVVNAPGVYNCTITAPGNCPTVMSTSVTSNNTLVVTTNTMSNPICQGSSATFTAAGATNYTWSPASSLSSGSASLVIASPTVTTTYTLTGSTGSCTSLPLALTLSVVICSGIHEMESPNGLNVYPNPNNGTFILESKEPMVIKLINSIGQEIKVLNLSLEQDNKFELRDLQEGVYFLQEEKSGKMLHNKIIVMRQ